MATARFDIVNCIIVQINKISFTLRQDLIAVKTKDDIDGLFSDFWPKGLYTRGRD